MDRDQLARLDALAVRTRIEVEREDPALLAAASPRRPAPDGSAAPGGPTPRPVPHGPAVPGGPVLPDGGPAQRPPVSTEDIVRALPMDSPIAVDPQVREQLGRARLQRLGAIAGLPDDRVDRVAVDGTPATLDDALLSALVDAGELPEAQARDLGLTVSLYRLVDEDMALTERLRGTVDALAGQPVSTVRDLARLRQADWHRLLDEAGITPPVGLDRAEHAKLLEKRVEALFPTDTLLARVLPDGGSPVLQRFLATNDGIELIDLDYTQDSGDLAGIDFAGLDDVERRTVLSTLKGYQRAYALTADADHAATLIAAGYTSATAIVADGFESFSAKTTFTAETAKRYFGDAVVAVGTAAGGTMSILDSIRDGFTKLEVGNVGADINDYFRRIDGFADLFGKQDYCDCGHCSSILGPGAYFVDLMHFVETTLVDRFFTGALAGHPLSLRTRRPDLWTLKVTCDNATTEISQLVIVNEILENYVARRGGYTGSLADRDAVHRVVYRDRIAARVDSFRQPMLLPLVRLRTYLRHFYDEARGGRSYADLVRILGGGPDVVADAELGLSATEHKLIAQPAADPALLPRVYGIAFTDEPDGTVRQIDAQLLLPPLGVTRAELGALVGTGYVSANGQEPVRIAGGRLGPGSVQNDIEYAQQLRRSSLDRLHRFTRLWRATGWTPAELDLTLNHLARAGLSAGIDDATLRQVPRVRALARRFAVPIEAVTVLYDTLPTNAVQSDAMPLFDRVFNLPDFVRVDQRLPKGTVRYVHPAFADNPAAPVLAIHRRLLAGLRVTAADLVTLVRALAPALGADPDAAAEADRGFLLTLANLSLLHRHARLAEWLRLPVPALFRLVALAPGITGTHVAGLADVEALLALSDRLRADNRTIDEVAYIVGDAVDSPARFPDPAGVADRLVKRIADDAVPAFADATAVLPDYLSAELSSPQATMTALLTLAEVDLAAPALVGALRGTSDIGALVTAVRRVARLGVLLGPLDMAGIAFVVTAPARFGLTDPAAPGLDTIARVDVYRRYAGRQRGADVRSVLASFAPATGFRTADNAALGRVFGVEATLAASVAGRVTLPGTPFAALAALGDCIGVAAHLGLGGEELVLLVAQDYDGLDDAADALLAAFRAKYPDERQWQAKIRPFDESLLERRRDALVDHLVHSVHPEFPTRADIYPYFLIDIEVEGCFTTSRIVAASSSLQLYVHRVLMNLEQDAAGAVHVRPDAINRDEWDWRAHYRVWEANRKVFLWPENYVVPDLRDDKTPLFAELEAQLLQKEIDEQGVLDAYGAYLEGFRELAGLQIAGSYHDVDTWRKADVLHLFGVTPGDPLTYYHRTVDNAYHGEVLDNRGVVWGAWTKMDVKIPVRRVAPVVQNGQLSVFWVEVTTTPQNAVIDSGSRFVGYAHRLAVKFTTLRLDGHWTAPQDVRLYGVPPFVESDGVLDDPLAEPEEWEAFFGAFFGKAFGVFANPNVSSLDAATRALMTPRYDTQPHTRARDGYTLRGREWEQVFPEPRWNGVFLAGVGLQLRADVDLFAKEAAQVSSISIQRLAMTFNYSPPSPVLCKQDQTLWYGTPSFAYLDNHAYAALVADRTQVERVFRTWEPSAKNTLALKDLYVGRIATIGTGTVNPINGALTDGIVDVDGDLYLVQSSVRAGAKWLVRRLGTTLGDDVHRALFTSGVEGLLALSTQRSLREDARRITPVGTAVEDAIVAGRLDFTGPFGTYYREIFFHVPFLIAHHLNSQGKYEQARRWYQYLFDPTASEVIPDDPALTPAANAARKKDRNWRYLEFRGLDVPALREILTDGQAIEAYRKDPFNPHAIARLRLTAYQKAIVMRYVDNLLDWGDELFTQFQMETVNEATILYATAADILGSRPASLGDCGERKRTWTYEELRPALAAASEFLVEVEQLTWVRTRQRPTRRKQKLDPIFTLDPVAATSATRLALGKASLVELGLTADPVPDRSPGGGQIRAVGRARIAGDAAVAALPATAAVASNVRVTAGTVPAGDAPAGGAVVRTGWKTAKGDARGSRIEPELTIDTTIYVDGDRFGGYLGWSVVRQILPAFCVPQNKDLLGYWDRVKDRLDKIRGCRDITGARRSLSLFAPEIDPMLLVRARAAGLSTQDVLSALAAEVPPYRFSYLIEKAKQYTATVQGFGAALQSALERRDAEELTLLRNAHQRNLLVLSTKVREWDRDAAAASVEALEKRRAMVEHRRDYYQGLLNRGLVAEEWAQRIFRHVATGGKSLEATFGFLAGALNLLPQVGSPFAMKYGGMEIGNSAHRFAVGTRALSDLADTLSASASLEAGFVRRDEGWRQQAEAAVDELAELERQLAVAQLRLDIARQSVTVHEETLKQADEVIAFYADRFTELGLYTYLSATLQGLHRNAYNAAFTLARLAERALRYERDDLGTTPPTTDGWVAGRAGLLAGARLMTDLQALELQYLTTNHRMLEVDQSFSVAQVDPAALATLKETGECLFKLPEVLFDLVYPGHYRRRIKTVRLTVPCVTGPYTNVAATLTLDGNWLRREPGLSDSGLTEEPIGRTVSVATSSAQNDAGVFELTFRDERYLPFEGAGAVSRWRLTLPKSFRQFDYRTINDVIVRIAYTALADDGFRTDVEEINAQVAGTIAQVLADDGLTRLVSLRQELSTPFNRLLHSPTGTAVVVELTAGHLPHFLHDKEVSVARARLVLQPTDGQSVDGATFTIGTVQASGFTADDDLGGLPAVDVTAAFSGGLTGRYELTCDNSGDLAPDTAVPGDPSAVDAAKLHDVLLHLEYTLATS